MLSFLIVFLFDLQLSVLLMLKIEMFHILWQTIAYGLEDNNLKYDNCQKLLRIQEFTLLAS